MLVLGAWHLVDNESLHIYHNCCIMQLAVWSLEWLDELFQCNKFTIMLCNWSQNCAWRKRDPKYCKLSLCCLTFSASPIGIPSIASSTNSIRYDKSTTYVLISSSSKPCPLEKSHECSLATFCITTSDIRQNVGYPRDLNSHILHAVSSPPLAPPQFVHWTLQGNFPASSQSQADFTPYSICNSYPEPEERRRVDRWRRTCGVKGIRLSCGEVGVVVLWWRGLDSAVLLRTPYIPRGIMQAGQAGMDWSCGYG